jgi:hypothetical protein
MGLLVDGCGDGSRLKVGRHLSKKVCGYQFYFPGEAHGCKGTADRKAVNGVNIDSGQVWDSTKEMKRFLKAFIFILVTFNNTDGLSPGAMLGKSFRKAVGFLAMVFSTEHASDNSNL